MAEVPGMDGWTFIGRIELAGEKLGPPSTPLRDVPGLYRLEFADGSLYFGETGNLKRRIGDYLLYYQATGIESEFRINKALHKSGGADLAIVLGEDYQSRSQRCGVESRLIREAKDMKKTVLNGGSIPSRIAFHAAEIIRLSEKLANPVSNTGEQK